MNGRHFAVLVTLLAALGAGGDPTPGRLVDQWALAVHTLADAHSLATAIEAYRMDEGRYPAAKDAQELRAAIEPTYIRKAVVTDAWGTALLYRVSSDGKSYVIASAGSDKAFDESAWGAGYTTSSKDDLVLKSDGFVREWRIQDGCR